MTTARSTVGVAVLNGRLYAVGGRDGSACLNSVECYDPHTNKWTLTCPMLKRRGGKNNWRNCVAQIKEPSTVKIAWWFFFETRCLLAFTRDAFKWPYLFPLYPPQRFLKLCPCFTILARNLASRIADFYSITLRCTLDRNQKPRKKSLWHPG